MATMSNHSRYPGNHSTCFEAEFDRMPKTDYVKYIIRYILETVAEMQTAYLQNHHHYENLCELLAYKYGVQSTSELEDDALEEFANDVKKKRRDNISPPQSPASVFHEMLAWKYGVQSVYELDSDALEELREDVEMIVELMSAPIYISRKNSQ